MTTASGADDVSAIKAEWQRVNLWHILAVVAAGFGTVAVNSYLFGGSVTEIRRDIKALQDDTASLRVMQDREQTARLERGKQTDANFKSLNDQLPRFDLMQQQITRLNEIAGDLRKGLDATNDRQERQQTLQADKLDKIIDAVADLRGDMKTVQSQLSDTGRPTNRTRFTTPMIRP